MRPEELGHLERFSVGSRLHALGRVFQNRSLLMSWQCSFVLPVPIVPHWFATVVLGNAPQSQLRFFLTVKQTNRGLVFRTLIYGFEICYMY